MTFQQVNIRGKKQKNSSQDKKKKSQESLKEQYVRPVKVTSSW